MVPSDRTLSVAYSSFCVDRGVPNFMVEFNIQGHVATPTGSYLAVRELAAWVRTMSANSPHIPDVSTSAGVRTSCPDCLSPDSPRKC